MRRSARATAAALALAGVALLGWTAVTLLWGEPFTAFTAAREQRALSGELAREAAAWKRGTRTVPSATPAQRAAAFRARLRSGDALGRIVVPRIGLRAVVVEGTDRGDLARGPGHYPMTPMPGSGGTVAIAGHRTTYSQPFRHIDELRRGDQIDLELPYGTFRYVVQSQAIVDDHDWSILERRPYEQLVLTACHPLYSASERIVVFARLLGARPAV